MHRHFLVECFYKRQPTEQYIFEDFGNGEELERILTEQMSLVQVMKEEKRVQAEAFFSPRAEVYESMPRSLRAHFCNIYPSLTHKISYVEGGKTYLDKVHACTQSLKTRSNFSAH